MNRIFSLTAWSALMLALLAGCAGSTSSGDKGLPDVQIREYQGEHLSDLSDFHENSIKGPQRVDIGSYRLKVTGLVEKPLSYTYAEVLSGHTGYTKLVTLDCVEGWAVKILWEGLLVDDIIKEAGVLPAANTVIFHAHDGYTTSLPLSYIRDKNIMLAHKINGVELPPDRGFPFQLVAEDKWGYKWIKWVTAIELSDDPNYKGYWERAGYSNDADLDKPFFDR
ncbi:MAG: molybdopterin-dependent oxidoreductase [Dehalococcoidia bacterium]